MGVSGRNMNLKKRRGWVAFDGWTGGGTNVEVGNWKKTIGYYLKCFICWERRGRLTGAWSIRCSLARSKNVTYIQVV